MYSAYLLVLIVKSDKIVVTVVDKELERTDYVILAAAPFNHGVNIVNGVHEHFQGGNYTFAMAKAPIETEFEMQAYPNVRAGIVKWPMSVIRVSSQDRHELAKCCSDILSAWRAYTDEKVGIFAETEGTPHNTITPIARKNGELITA